MAAIATTVIDNKVKGTFRQRSHNSLFLFNECLAEHQSAYFLFAITLAIGTNFTQDWAKPAIAVFAAFTLMSYVWGVSITSGQEEEVRLLHVCTGTRCSVPIPAEKKLQLLWVNLLFSLVLLVVSVVFCFMTTKAPG